MESYITKKFEGSVSLLSWAYNEEVLITSFLERAVALMEANVEDWEIVLVNDGSTDRTPEIIARYAEREPRIRLINHDKNLNVGWACRTAVANAEKEFLFWETVDWSYDLKNIRIFLELLKHFKVVQGIRPTPVRLFSYIPVIRSIYRVKTRSDNLKSAFVSLTNYYHLRLLYGVPFHDFQNVTFYPTKLAQSIDLIATSAFVNPELLIKSFHKGATFIEVPIRFIKRSAGQAKGIKPRALWNAFKDVWLNWFRWGLALRMKKTGQGNSRISRVYHHSGLTGEVAQLTEPLLGEFNL